MKVFLFCLCLCFVFCNGDENCTQTGETGVDIFCQSPNYTEVYTEETCFCKFSVPNGFQIEVTIEDLNLDSSNLDYLSLTTDEENKEYQFIYYLKQPFKILLNKSSVTLKFVANNKSTSHRGFRAHFLRYGEYSSTPELTTIINWPNPNENETIYYTVNISIPPNEFKQHSDEFKLHLVNMTKNYCKTYNFELASEVTEKNINIRLAKQCPIEWPDSQNCVQVQYAIPVFLVNCSNYQFTTEHLRKMWFKFAVEEFASLGWHDYQPPNNKTTTLIWIICFLMVLLVFMCILIFCRMFSIRFSNRIKRRASDAQQIISTPSRVSNASLWPTSSQIIPPLFENDNKYDFYEPDKSSEQRNNFPNKMFNADDSEDEILTITNDTIRHFKENGITLDYDHSRESAL